MNTVITVVLTTFVFGLGFLIGNGFHEFFRYMPNMKDKKKEVRKLRADLESEQIRRASAERRAEIAEKHVIFEHIFKIETDSEKCDLFEPW